MLAFREARRGEALGAKRLFLGQWRAWSPGLRARLSLVSLVLLAGCNGEPSLIEDWGPISQQRFPLHFAAPGIEGRDAEYLRAVQRQRGYPVVATTARWAAGPARKPHARLDVRQGGAKFGRSMDTEGALTRMLTRMTEDVRGEPPAPGWHWNALGAIAYLLTHGTEEECLVFAQEWRRGRIVSLLAGYYCTTTEEGLTPEKVHAMLGGISEK